jgi:hypothetical protein
MEEGADAGDGADAEVMASHPNHRANHKPQTPRVLNPKVNGLRAARSHVLAHTRAGSKIADSRIDVPAAEAVASSSVAKVVIADPRIQGRPMLESIRPPWITVTARTCRMTMAMDAATPVATRNRELKR